MSYASLSCKPVRDSLEVCEHLIHESLPCNLCKLQKQITALADMYRSLSISLAAQPDFKKPHRCPICDGKGLLGELALMPVSSCKSCSGKGIVWG